MKKTKKGLYDELIRQYLFEQLFENIHSQLLLLDKDYKKKEDEMCVLFRHIKEKTTKETFSDIQKYLDMCSCHKKRFYREIYLYAVRNTLYILKE